MFDGHTKRPHMSVVTDYGEYPFDLCNRVPDLTPGKTYLWHRLGPEVPQHIRQKVYVPREEYPDSVWEDIVITARNGQSDVIAVTVVSNNGYEVIMENRLGGGVVTLTYKRGGPEKTATHPALPK